MTPGRRVVCAAIRNKAGRIIVGPRHYDMVMIMQINSSRDDWSECEQGFVDQHGNFMTRKEAWVVANGAKQILRPVGGNQVDGGTLYSENLY